MLETKIMCQEYLICFLYKAVKSKIDEMSTTLFSSNESMSHYAQIVGLLVR